MIDIDKAREGLLGDNSLMYREYDGTISYTIWKSIETPDIYYWYTIQDVPRKKNQAVVSLFESGVFYNLDDLFMDFERGDSSGEIVC